MATSAIAASAAAGSILAAGTAQAATTPVSYTVQSGDTLSGIAQKEHVPGGWQAIAEANHISNPNLVQVGEHLVLPAGSGTSSSPGTGSTSTPGPPVSAPATTTYTVRAGDTLSGIAQKEHVPGGWQAIAKINHITSPYIVHIGQHLTLPTTSGSTGTTAPLPFPIPVAVGNATQVITVQAHGSYATVIAWQKTGTAWHQVYSTSQARIGSHGITNGATRHQGTDTTPTGTYTITHGFGVGANPGTAMPYHHVRSDDWWVEDPSSPYYNQMRTSEQGGFPLTEAGYHGSEHLINYPTQYHNALVINFNTDPAVPGRGAGIFLHDLGPQAGPTGGCIALPASVMTDIMRWINPAQHPVIAID